MKSLYNYLFSIALVVFTHSVSAQSVVVEVDGDDLYYSEGGCGDCWNSPDPRWRSRVNIGGGGNVDWNVDRDDFGGCGWKGISNTSWHAPSVRNASDNIVFSFDGEEDDPNNILCNGDDADCGGFATLRTINNICDNAPYTWNYFTDSRSCNSDGTTGTYQIYWSYWWRYNEAPTISSQPTANTVLCQGNTTTLSVTTSTDFCGRVMSRWYKWQIAPTPTGPWTDIAGANNVGGSVNTATALSYSPLQISGTRYYQLLMSSNQSADFSSNTVISNTATVTYAFINSGAYGGGGGGGGGSGGGILLSAFGNFSCTGTLNAKGGNGGNGGNKGTGGQNNADNGENGGGGGGGRIKIFTNPCATNSIPLQGNSVDNGTGKNNGSIGSFYSGNHPSYTPLDAKTITTANQTICYNTSPAAIDAETSVGGAYDAISSCKTSLPAYQYTWYVAKTTATCAISQTTTSTATSPASGWNLLVGPGTTFEDLTAAQVRAGYQTAGTDSYIPLRIAQAGVMPIIFAGSILQLPQILSMFFLKSANPTLLSLGGKFKSFTSDNLWYMIVYFVLIFFFTYFYTAVTFDAEAMANNLQKNGAFVPNVRPGAPTADYVATILARTTFFGAVFFSIIAVMPFILQRMTGNALFAIGGTAILIAVSVCTDLIKKLSAQASMKEY